VLLLQPSPEASEANLRYLQCAYWRLLQHCYFATDTDNTKVQVRNGSNRIWPLAELQTGEGGGYGLEGGGEGEGGVMSVQLQRFLDLPAGGERASSLRSAGAGSCLIQVGETGRDGGSGAGGEPWGSGGSRNNRIARTAGHIIILQCLKRVGCVIERSRAAAEPAQTDIACDSTATNRTPRLRVRIHFCYSYAQSGENLGEGQRGECRRCARENASVRPISRAKQEKKETLKHEPQGDRRRRSAEEGEARSGRRGIGEKVYGSRGDSTDQRGGQWRAGWTGAEQ
jgi:hypothetical protein